jgi:hypothetical protein
MCKDVPEHNPKYTELDLRPGGRYVIEIPVPKEGFTYRGYGTFREVKPPKSWCSLGPGSRFLRRSRSLRTWRIPSRS